MKVVIIDDDKLVSMSLKMILENGTDIEVAAVGEDGREAVSLYKKYSPDILLLDIRMQYMTGLEAARNVFAAYPDAKILFLTTFFQVTNILLKHSKIGVKGIPAQTGLRRTGSGNPCSSVRTDCLWRKNCR